MVENAEHFLHIKKVSLDVLLLLRNGTKERVLEKLKFNAFLFSRICVYKFYECC